MSFPSHRNAYDDNNPGQYKVYARPNAKDDVHRIREIFMVSDQFA